MLPRAREKKYLYLMKKWFLFLFSRAFVKTLVFSVLFVVLAVVGSLIALNRATNHGQSIAVPNLKYLTLEDALDSLVAKGLEYEVIDSTHYVSQAPVGSVVDQFPVPYAEVKLGRKILLTTNPASLPKYPLPSFKDQLLSYVRGKFSSKGFRIDSTVIIPDLSHDLVLKVMDKKGQTAREGDLYETGTGFVFYISGGETGGNTFLPNLIGLKYAEALLLIESKGMSAGALVIDGELKDTASSFIWKQFPNFNPDQQLPKGSLIDIWLTDDSTQVPILEVTDSTLITPTTNTTF